MRSLSLFLFFLVLVSSSIVSPAYAGDVGPTVVKASWYGSQELEGAPMADGEPFNADDRTIAAHRKYRFGTRLRVTNLENGESIDVTVQDRGPYVKGRGIDLSRAAAEWLGFKKKGVVLVMIEVLGT